MNGSTGGVQLPDRKQPITRFRLRTMLSASIMLLASVSMAPAETTTAASAEQQYGTPAGLPFTLSGSYLSGRLAGFSQDFGQAAAFFEEALSADPTNIDLLERTFLLKLANGDVDQAILYAADIDREDLDNFIAQLALGAGAMIDGDYANAEQRLQHDSESPLAQLTVTISRAWGLYGQGKVDEAITAIDGLNGPDWFDVFKETHKAHLNFAAGNQAVALESIENAYAQDQGAVRVIDTLARLLAVNGKPDEGLKILGQFDTRFRNHPQIVATQKLIESGDAIPPMVEDPSAGMSEILYGLGAVIGRDGAQEISTAYLQLALHLDPNAEFAAMALGNVYERMNQPKNAIKAFSRVPEGGILKREAEIQIGLNYNDLDDVDEARIHFRGLIDADPSDLEAITALGNVLRSHEIYDEAEAVYSEGLAMIDTLEQHHWLLKYFRGISRERLDKWDLAEEDFRTALDLNPDQPLVLNYLGYSLVDQGLKLDEALGMIEKAVELRPTDGYIVDSLGWVYYRLGRYEEAVKELERAIELRPGDPVINDHLGDAYWMVGRRNEARFQWNHARDLDPEEDELPKILDKIENGLQQPDVAEENTSESDTNGG